MTFIGGHSRPVQQIPEPSRFWIAHAPRSWKALNTPWSDLASGRFEGFQRRSDPALSEIDAADLDDVFYIPPVDPKLRRQRNEQVQALVEAGTSVLVHALPGEENLPEAATVVYDLLQPLIDGELERLLTLPPGSTAAWPLIPGLTDPPETCDEGCALLASRGVRCVQPLTLELTPLASRRLAEGREDDIFDALFHGAPMSERKFSRIAGSHELAPFMERPPVALAPRYRSNRQIATKLAMIAEYWLRLEKSLIRGQCFLRAARSTEKTHHHLAALTKEKNLKIITWLDTRSHDLVKEIVLTGSSALLDRLASEYLGHLSAGDADDELGGDEESDDEDLEEAHLEESDEDDP